MFRKIVTLVIVLPLAAVIIAFAAAERLNLDGLLALWHPSPVN